MWLKAWKWVSRACLSEMKITAGGMPRMAPIWIVLNISIMAQTLLHSLRLLKLAKLICCMKQLVTLWKCLIHLAHGVSQKRLQQQQLLSVQIRKLKLTARSHMQMRVCVVRWPWLLTIQYVLSLVLPVWVSLLKTTMYVQFTQNMPNCQHR